VKALALSNGDLVVGPNGHVTISGVPKVRQDLALNFGERWGFDRFHGDRWGSLLVDYIGQPINADTETLTTNEVSRTIAQYISIQDTEVYQDLVSGARSRYESSEVIRQINNIEVTSLYDSIRVKVDLVTQAGVGITLNRTVVA
jgi:hypothetical protein